MYPEFSLDELEKKGPTERLKEFVERYRKKLLYAGGIVAIIILLYLLIPKYTTVTIYLTDTEGRRIPDGIINVSCGGYEDAFMGQAQFSVPIGTTCEISAQAEGFRPGFDSFKVEGETTRTVVLEKDWAPYVSLSLEKPTEWFATGETTVLKAYVTNNGDTIVKIRLVPEGEISKVISPSEPVLVSPGEKREIDLRVNVPADVKRTKTFKGKIRIEGTKRQETLEITVTSARSISISPTRITLTAVAGKSASKEIKIRNPDRRVPVRDLKLSLSDEINVFWIKIGDYDRYIPPDGQIVVTLTAEPPLDTPEGEISGKLMIQCSREKKEIPVTIEIKRPKVELRVSPSSLRLEAGEEDYITITNKGELPFYRIEIEPSVEGVVWVDYDSRMLSPEEFLNVRVKALRSGAVYLKIRAYYLADKYVEKVVEVEVE